MYMNRTLTALLFALSLTIHSMASETNVVFFLDIDGVLNSRQSGTMFPDDASKYALNPDNVTCLTNLLALCPGSKVVLHTGWNKRAFDATWNFHGRTYQGLVPQVTNVLGNAYIGITTHIPLNEGGCKAREILKWIEEHPATNTVYVVLDDDTGPNSTMTKGAFPLWDLQTIASSMEPVWPAKDGDIMVNDIDKTTGLTREDVQCITNWLNF